MDDLMQDGHGCAEGRRYARWFADRMDAMWLLRKAHNQRMTTMTTEQDTMRAEFEAAYVKAYPVSCSIANKFERDPEAPDEYDAAPVQIGWVMYQAGRAAAQAAEPVAPGELPTTEAGWLHRCDQKFAEGYQKGRASAAQGAEPVAEIRDGELAWHIPRPDYFRPILPDGTLLYAAQAPKAGDAVPRGWKLVPVEPTAAMRRAGFYAAGDPHHPAAKGNFSTIAAAWDAMLAAAPAAATKETNHG